MGPHPAPPDFSAAALQAIITFGLAALFAFLYRAYRKQYFAWWALAWLLYAGRLVMIITFLITRARIWLYWHQVLTGWTALTLLWATLSFSRQVRWRWMYTAVVAVPVFWAYFAIFRLQNELVAMIPIVALLSLATLWTGLVFWRYARRTDSGAGRILAYTLLFWGLHHLDYPFLRARGALNPWSYYLDVAFILALGIGILLLVVEELHRGVSALSALSGDLQPRGEEAHILDGLLTHPLALPGVRGSAYVVRAEAGLVVLRGTGVCIGWRGSSPQDGLRNLIARAMEERRPTFGAEVPPPIGAGGGPLPYTAILPILSGTAAIGALVIVGDTRDPFTALDTRFLAALGQQVGAALENEELYRRLRGRTAELERLSQATLRQLEEQRRRIALELHDETAQVLAAVKMQVGTLREAAPVDLGVRFGHVLELVDTGMRSIRRVTDDLRPPLLDDLGLVPALRALVDDFGEDSGLAARFTMVGTLPPLSQEAEVALFRVVQEGLSNVARHAGAGSAVVQLSVVNHVVELTVEDDGCGLTGATEGYSGLAGMGLPGMRQRLETVGGTLVVENLATGGLSLRARIQVYARAKE